MNDNSTVCGIMKRSVNTEKLAVFFLRAEQRIEFICFICLRISDYSLFHGFQHSFISIELCRDYIPALASSCKKQLTGFFVCLLVFSDRDKIVAGDPH